MKEEKTSKMKITGISESIPDKDRDMKIDLQDGLKKKLPENFNIDEIGSIDLREAEKIANEDILFLTEEDLIAGLEDFDLIPLKDNKHESREEITAPDKVVSEVIDRVTGTSTIDVNDDVKPSEDNSHKERKQVSNEEAEQALIDSIIHRESTDEDKAEERETLTEENAQDNITAEAVETESVELQHDRKEIIREQVTEKDYAEVIEEQVDRTSEEKELTGEAPVNRNELDETADTETGIETVIIPDQMKDIGSGDSSVRFIDDETVEKEDGPPSPAFEENELEKITADIVDIIEGKSIILSEAQYEDDRKSIATMQSDDRYAYSDILIDFDDDEYKYRDTELDFIDTSIIDDDYSSYIKKIDEYYDEKDSAESTKSSQSIEIFGLSNSELGGMESHLFDDDYKGIDIESEIDLFRSDFGTIDLSETREKSYKYIIPDGEELEISTRSSIEEDLSSDNALIFEEDIIEIKRLLGRDVPAYHKQEEEVEAHVEIEAEEHVMETEPVQEVPEYSEEEPEVAVLTDSDLEIIDEDIFRDESPVDSELEEISDEEGGLYGSGNEEIYDITDKIVILEDELDIDRFIKEFPEEKQDNLKNLLKYLDGLFEKLPENTIKSFADSEYFDLYAKVLNDMGIS